VPIIISVTKQTPTIFGHIRSILSGYGILIRYEYIYTQRNNFRTKLYVSAPKSKKHVVGELVRRFGGRIREKEILITECYRNVIASSGGIIGYPLGYYGDWPIGVSFPCRKSQN